MSQIYLSRYAHLKHRVTHKEKDIITKGMEIGVMGNTGKSTGAHLHFDLIQEEAIGLYRLHEIPGFIKDLPALMKQYNYFIDNELFDDDFRITTSFGDPTYDLPKWKFHPAYDLIPKHSYNKIIYWNRSMKGVVHKVGYDSGYGNYIIIKFEV